MSHITADEARKLREAATPGPWHRHTNPFWGDSGYIRSSSEEHVAYLRDGHDGNAALIAAAPSLAAEVERLSADNERLRSERDEAKRLLEAVRPHVRRVCGRMVESDVEAFLASLADEGGE